MSKITVKHYLNTKLKPEIDNNVKYYPLYLTITVKSKNIKRRSNIQDFVTENDFKNDFKRDSEIKGKVEYEKNLIERIIRLFINDIDKKSVKNNLISFFDSKGYNSKDNFINMLNAYIDFYSHSIYGAISNFCNDEIEKEVFAKLSTTFNLEGQSEAKDIFSYKSDPIHEVEFIYKNLSHKSIKCLVLRERLRSYLAPCNIKTGYDIPIIDWMDGLKQDELRLFFQTYKRSNEYCLKDNFKIDTPLIEEYIKIIDSIVYSDDYIEIAKDRMHLIF